MSTYKRVLFSSVAVLFAGVLTFAHVRQSDAAPAEMLRSGDNDMSGHMKMTKLRPMVPGDQARADAIQASAKKVMDHYVDYHKALDDGYTIFFPDQPQHIYHFTLNSAAMNAESRFDASRPTSLLYEKGSAGQPKYRLVGVMYTAPLRASQSDLDARVPLSIAQWHVHSDICLPPANYRGSLVGSEARFGFAGSINTPDACRTAGGRFLPHIFGWMVHVYAYEKDPAKIWSTGMDDDDDHMTGMTM